MKKILVFGDSNTWGQKAYGGRYDRNFQWPKILEMQIPGIEVCQHGVCARTAGNYESSDKEYRNGQQYFENSVRMTGPFDILIIALGTNDLKNYYNKKSDEIVDALLWYADAMHSLAEGHEFRDSPKPGVFFLGIPNFINTEYFEGNEEKRIEVNNILRTKVENFIEIDNLRLSEDGVHYSGEDHEYVATKVKQALRSKYEI